MGVCATNSEKSHFWIFPTSDVTVLWISPIVHVKCYTPNNVLNYSSHMYTRILRPYIFFISKKWLPMNFYNYSLQLSSPFSVNGSPTLIEGRRGVVGLFPPTPLSQSFLLGSARALARKFSVIFPPIQFSPGLLTALPPLGPRGRGGGGVVKSRMCPPYPQLVVKGD